MEQIYKNINGIKNARITNTISKQMSEDNKKHQNSFYVIKIKISRLHVITSLCNTSAETHAILVLTERQRIFKEKQKGPCGYG